MANLNDSFDCITRGITYVLDSFLNNNTESSKNNVVFLYSCNFKSYLITLRKLDLLPLHQASSLTSRRTVTPSSKQPK